MTFVARTLSSCSGGYIITVEGEFVRGTYHSRARGECANSREERRHHRNRRHQDGPDGVVVAAHERVVEDLDGGVTPCLVGRVGNGAGGGRGRMGREGGGEGGH